MANVSDAEHEARQRAFWRMLGVESGTEFSRQVAASVRKKLESGPFSSHVPHEAVVGLCRIEVVHALDRLMFELVDHGLQAPELTHGERS